MHRVVAFATRNGGFCTRAEALAATSRREVEEALSAGAIVWLSRGRYGLPQLDLDVATAHGMRGVLSHLSAALWHGWEVKSVPGVTHVTLPRRRRCAPAPTVRVHRHRHDLAPDEVVDGICTSVARTLLDCLTTLPFDEALCVADSALRHGADPEALAAVGLVRGRGRPTALRAVAAADGRAANPFESCLRAIALGVPGLDVRPQVLLRTPLVTARPDLVDEALRIILEADSFAWHGGRAQLVRDARRYNALVVDRWMVLRFSYEQTMFHPGEVDTVLRTAVHARHEVPRNRRHAA